MLLFLPILVPPSLRFIDFWLPFLTSKGPSTAKNSQEPPRTCQEPAETQNTQRHTAPNFADRRTAPTATKRRARIRGAAVCTPHGVFNPLRARRRPRRVCGSDVFLPLCILFKESFLSFFFKERLPNCIVYLYFIKERLPNCIF